MAEDIEKRLKSVESGFVIVATDVVRQMEEVGRDVRELGRESRDMFRELRDIRQDMRASFGQASGEMTRIEENMATMQGIVAIETRMNARFNKLIGDMNDQFAQVIALLTPRDVQPPEQGE